MATAFEPSLNAARSNSSLPDVSVRASISCASENSRDEREARDGASVGERGGVRLPAAPRRGRPGLRAVSVEVDAERFMAAPSFDNDFNGDGRGGTGGGGSDATDTLSSSSSSSSPSCVRRPNASIDTDFERKRASARARRTRLGDALVDNGSPGAFDDGVTRRESVNSSVLSA